MPPTVPFNHYLNGLKKGKPLLENQQNKTSSLISLSHANLCKALFFNFACFEHSNLFKVKGSEFYRGDEKKLNDSSLLDKTTLKRRTYC